MSNFIDDCIHGRALVDDVDDYVDRWHETESDAPLHDYLGMSESEYSLWVAEASALPFIVVAHQQHRDVKDVLNEFQSTRLAARSDGRSDNAAELIKWLKKQGLWE
jgi:hypothetical protein